MKINNSNYTEVAWDLVPKKIDIPFNEVRVVLEMDKTTSVQFRNNHVVMWEKNFGRLEPGDTISIDKIEGKGAIEIRRDLNP